MIMNALVKDYKLTADERETIIRYSDGDDLATIETCNKALINKLRKIYRVVSENRHSITFECDKALISFRPAKRRRGSISKEHKEKLIKARNERRLMDEGGHFD